MGIRKKTFFLNGLLFVFLILFYFVFTKFFIAQISNTFEQNNINSWNQGVAALFENIKQEIYVRSGDWANWDDTYEFVQNQNTRYIDRNLNADGYKSLQVDFIAYLDLTGKIIYVKAHDSDVDEPVIIDNDYFLKIYEQHFKEKDFPKEGKVGLANINNQLFIVSIRSVFDSKVSKPANGIIIFGRKAVKEVNKIKKLKQIDVDISSFDRKTNKDEQIIIASSELKDINNFPIAHLIVSKQKDEKDLKIISTYAGIFLIIVSIIYWLFFVFSIDKLLLSRILSLTSEISNIRDPSSRVTPYGSDEISNLGHSINALLSKLETIQEAIRVNEEQFRKAITLSNDCVILIDEDNEISYWNQTAEKKLGFSNQEAIGSNFYDLLDIDELKTEIESHIDEIAAIEQEGRFKTIRQIITNKVGTIMNVEVTISTIQFRGKPNIILIIKDITQFENTSNKLSLLLSNCTNAVSIIDSGNIFTFVGDNTYKILGFLPQELQGLSAWEIVAQNDIKKLSTILEEIMWQPGEEREFEFTAKTKGKLEIKLKGKFINYFHDTSINGIIFNFYLL